LYASGDSVTKAQLRPACKQALRLSKDKVVDPIAHHLRLVEMVARDAHEFDIIHFHLDYFHYAVTRRVRYTALTTLHGRLDIPELVPLYREFDDMKLVSISDSQRRPLPWANWVATVYHGLPLSLCELREKPGKYLAFLGRISPEKRLDRAIEIAKRVGIPLKIAAKIDPVDQDYFESEIRHLLDPAITEFVGEICDGEKSEFLGNALAFLFPIDWPEPFGLVMIEAMACGTPVIAYRNGSVPEIIEHGVTGYIVNNLDEAVKAVQCANSFDRLLCRRIFEKRFSTQRMALDYLNVYEGLLNGAPVDTKQAAMRGVAYLDSERSLLQ